MRRSKLLIDLSPLRRFPQFRILWSGFLIRTIGNQLTVVAVPFVILRITKSSFDVGLVSLVQLGPLLVGSLFGGTIVDSFDRRRLLIGTQILLASDECRAPLLNPGAHHPAVWPLFICSAASAGFQGVDSPASSALIVSVVDRQTIVGANALWQALFSTGQIAGPAIAGVLLSRFPIETVFWIDVASYAVSLVTVLRLSRPPALHPDGGRELGLRAMLGGVRYLKGHQPLKGIFLADLDAMVLGMPRALFPAPRPVVRFHGGATAVGLLCAAPGFGVRSPGRSSPGWVSAVRRPEKGGPHRTVRGLQGVAIALLRSDADPLARSSCCSRSRALRTSSSAGDLPRLDPAARRPRPTCSAACRRCRSRS